LHQADAIRILGNLTDAFPAVELDEGNTEILVQELGYLHDPVILEAAVEVLIQREERFPTIARIRTSYRAVAEAQSTARAALERASEPAGANIVPEWVSVWWWHKGNTLTARQAANETTNAPVTERPPVRMREFPQLPQPLAPDAYTWPEYEAIREDWAGAGSPSVGSVAELIEGMTA
jgi:hypothetical protein